MCGDWKSWAVATRAYMSEGSVVGRTHSVIIVERMRGWRERSAGGDPGGEEEVAVMKMRNSPKAAKMGS